MACVLGALVLKFITFGHEKQNHASNSLGQFDATKLHINDTGHGCNRMIFSYTANTSRRQGILFQSLCTGIVAPMNDLDYLFK